MYQFTRVLKTVKEPPTVHTIWGNKVHKAIENRIKFKQPLPEDMQKWEPLAAKFDNAIGMVFTEKQLALTRNLTSCKWMDDNAWCRAIIDVGVDAGPRVSLFDWKTGKVKEDPDQLKLSAAIVMQDRPYVEKVKVGFIWLAHNKVTPSTYTRDDLPGIWEDFINRANRLSESYQQDKWLPKPSGLCRGWCPVGRNNCEFWTPKG